MSDEYDVVGLILKKKESNDGCAGCLGALVVVAIICAIIESCIGGKKKPANVPSTIYTEPPSVVQPGTSPTHGSPDSVSRPIWPAPPTDDREQRVRCRNCSGKGVKNVWTKCSTCNGNRRVVDQAKTAQSAMTGVVNGFARGRAPRQPPRPKTYYMSCPSCNGKGRISHSEDCHQCGGNGYLIKR